MAESRPVPTNLLSWPRVDGLLPDQKLIIFYLWSNRFATAAGCYQLPISMASVELGLSDRALSEALADFAKRDLIAFDRTTGEVFILDWFRFHKFATTSQNRQLDIALEKIESETLRVAVLNKINKLRANRTLTLTKALAKAKALAPPKAVTRANKPSDSARAAAGIADCKNILAKPLGGYSPGTVLEPHQRQAVGRPVLPPSRLRR